MSGIQPSTLSNEELVKYAWLKGAENLSSLWIKELMVRLEAYVDADAAEAASE